MIYPENYESKIGFNDIKALLSGFCQSELGRERVGELQMLTEVGAIRQKLQESQELETILEETVELPEMAFYDLRPSIQRIRLEGAHIEEDDLGRLKKSLDTLHSWLKIIRATADNSEEYTYPALNQLSMGVFTFIAVAGAIDKTLDKYGKIKDEASPELARIRHELRASEGSVNRTLHGILRTVKDEGLVAQGVTPTFREGRLVIPVSPTLKKRLRGIVHDESATGKTVFIEPQEVVEANNRIRELEAEEKREIIQILKHITMLIRPNTKELLRAFSFLADLEFVRARVSFAKHIGGIYPGVAPYPIIDWTLAQHPLLKISLEKQGKKVVPLEIKLDRKQHILIISGPNAGGKSVCLKTVGLIQYMLQCGLPVPVGENSKMGIFNKLAIDIGDEQSIEDDLSTYSSHLLNMKNMIKYADNRSLILIDEFGSGTEPNIGGAIAESVLMRFNRNRVFGIITTHYQNLKHYADGNEGIRNGAMLYDRHLMQPLYILQIGNPGSSFAVEIARKIGLPEDVIEDATQIVGRDYVNADKYLQDIVRDKRYWENKRQNVHQLEKQLDQQIEQHRQELESLQKERKSIIREAKEKADQLIQDSNAMIENTIRTIREAQADKELTRLARQELTDFKETIDDRQANSEDELRIQRKMERIRQSQERREQRKRDKLKEHHTQPASPAPSEPLNIPVTSGKRSFKVGDTVRLAGQTQVGEVISVNKSDVTVAFGQITTSVKANRLEPAQPVKVQEIRTATYVSKQTHDDIYNRKLAFKPDIDVRGMRGDEAIQTVMHFIDDATLIGMSRVHILHGTGNGILRNLIRQYLHTVPAVRDYHDEHIQFGGHGITVVDLG